MTLSLRYSAHCEVGLVRRSNQDSAYISPTMLMVADGMGGAAAGDLASTVAIDELRKTHESLAERLAAAGQHRVDAGDAASTDTTPGRRTPQADDTREHAEPLVSTAEDLRTVLAGAIARANDRIVELVSDDPALDGMGTTVCGVLLQDDGVAIVNIGDSRAYLLRDGVLRRLTRDHSWVQTLVDSGRITEQEALEHPHRSLVLNVVNGSPQHRPDLDHHVLREGDRIMICSDGLCGMVTDAQIDELIHGADRDEVIASLVALAYSTGGHDNITIVLADVVTGEPEGVTALLGAATTTPIPAAEHTASLPLLEEDPAALSERAITEEERYALQGRRRPAAAIKLLLLFVIPLLMVLGGGFAWYRYTQTQYFVGADDEVVAIFQGVPDKMFNLPLSKVVEPSQTRVDDLPPYYARLVDATIPAAGLEGARATVGELKVKAEQCIAQRKSHASPTPSPASSPSPSPTAPTSPGTVSPGVSPTPTPTVRSGSPTPNPAPEEC